MPHKTCVARHSCNVLIWWHYLSWPWPCLLFSIRPMLICYLLYPLGSLISLLWPCVKSRSSKVTRSKRSSLKFWVCITWYMFLGQVSVKNAKMTQEHFLNGPNRTKCDHRKNAEIAVNSVKSGLLGHSRRQNSAVFQNIDLKFCTHIHRRVFFHKHSLFSKI